MELVRRTSPDQKKLTFKDVFGFDVTELEKELDKEKVTSAS